MSRLERYDAYPIPASDIYFDPDFNCRGDFTLESVADLAASIRETGLKFPLVVQPWDGPQPYRLVAGHRRFRAMTVHLKAETIPCMVADGLDEFEARKLNLLENLERKDLNILEEALAIRRLFPQGTCRSIGEAVKRPPQWVNIRLQLLDLPEKVQQMAAAGLLKYSDIEALHRMEGKPSLKTKAAERAMESRSKHKQRRPRVGSLLYKAPTKVRSKNAINKLVERLLLAGVTGLAPRVGAWCAGEIGDEELEDDIQQVLENQTASDGPI